MDKKKIYFNRSQIESMTVAANSEFIVASRGYGKSEGIDAPRMLRNVLHMPRSLGALLSPTHTKMLTNTLPAVKIGLARMGFKQDIHYVIGRKPDKKLGFTTPRRIVDKYDYVMSWFNGTVVFLLSFDRPMSANSLSLDWIMGFEAKFLDYDKIINEVFPAMRGNIDLYENCPWHGGMVFTTDMPTMKSGMWILEKEKQMDKELIQVILQTEADYRFTKSLSNGSDYYKTKLKSLKDDLNLFRKNATFYAEYDIFDNLELIGEKKIRDFKRDLPPLIFQTAILNKRILKIANGFYSALRERIHYYEAKSPEYIEGLFYDLEKSSNRDCRMDGDIDKSKPLIVSFDYNAAINSVVTAQVTDKKEMPTISSFFVKTPKKLKEAVENWCDYYQYHPCKQVIYYYDSTAIAETAVTSDSFADEIINILNKRGWEVHAEYVGQPMRHDTKHNHIDRALKGDPEYLFPSFNKHNNEYLLLAMDQTGIKQGRNGFEKDKDLEKKLDSPDSPDELKTHITDAWDTLFVGCNFFPVSWQTSSMISTTYGG